MSDNTASTPLALHFGGEELLIRKRYEVLSIVNDILVALWFTVGSALFFSEATNTAGVWLFLIGSIELGIRPMIRLSRHMHLQRIQSRAYATHESDQDF